MKHKEQFHKRIVLKHAGKCYRMLNLENMYDPRIKHSTYNASRTIYAYGRFKNDVMKYKVPAPQHWKR